MKKHNILFAIVTFIFLNASILQASGFEEGPDEESPLLQNIQNTVYAEDLTQSFVTAVNKSHWGDNEDLRGLIGYADTNDNVYVTGDFFTEIKDLQAEEQNIPLFENIDSPASFAKFIVSKIKREEIEKWDLDEDSRNSLEALFFNFVNLFYEEDISGNMSLIKHACEKESFPCFVDWNPSEALKTNLFENLQKIINDAYEKAGL